MFTFCDRLEGKSKKRFLEQIQNGSGCKYGQVALASPQRNDSDEEDEPHGDVDFAKEQAAFKGMKNLPPDFAGANNVHMMISKVYLDQVYRRWLPNAADQVLQAWQDSAMEDIALGQPPSPGNLAGEQLKKLQEAAKAEVERRLKDLPDTPEWENKFKQQLKRLPDWLNTEALSSEEYIRECECFAIEELDRVLFKFVREVKGRLMKEDDKDVLKIRRFPRYKGCLLEMVRVKFIAASARQRLKEAMRDVLQQPMEFPVETTLEVLRQVLASFHKEKTMMVAEAFQQEKEAVHKDRVDISDQMRACDDALEHLEEMRSKGISDTKELSVTVQPGFSISLCESLSWHGRCKSFMEEQFHREEETRKEEDEDVKNAQAGMDIPSPLGPEARMRRLGS